MLVASQLTPTFLKIKEKDDRKSSQPYYPYRTHFFRSKYQKKQSLILAKNIKQIIVHDKSTKQECQKSQIFIENKNNQTNMPSVELSKFRISKLYQRKQQKKSLSFNNTFYSNRVQKKSLMSKINQRPPTSQTPNAQYMNTTTRIRKISNINEQNNDNFLAKYQILQQLGKGMYGTVHLAKKKIIKPKKWINKSLLISLQNKIQNQEQIKIDQQQIYQSKQLINYNEQKNKKTVDNFTETLKVNAQNLSTICELHLQKNQTLKDIKDSTIITDSKTIQQTSSCQQLVAIKVYQKFKMNKDPTKFKNIRKQITVMQNLNHEGIIKLYQSVESITKICLVVQYGGKQSLLDYLKRNFPLRQIKIKQFSRQLLNILIYLHDKNIVHRDIKPQNILIKQNGENSQQLKLIDFGFSTLTNKFRKLNAICGTPNFMAPQLLSSKQYFGQKADTWSFGVVVFVMAEGRHPFKSNDYKQLGRLANKGKYTFKRNHSQDFQQFIAKILKVNSHERPAAKQILNFKWLQQQ